MAAHKPPIPPPTIRTLFTALMVFSLFILVIDAASGTASLDEASRQSRDLTNRE
jgi:hypothetical protein